MCLFVDLNYHKVKKHKPIALVAKQSILVHKVLTSDGKHYCTPCMNKAINFDDEYGMFFYKTTRFSIFFDDYDFKVSRGIHSFIDIDVATDAKEHFRIIDYPYKKSNVHYAIIPKGSKFYIGWRLIDIASSNLVVFENETKYNENKEYFGDEPIEFSEYLRKFGTELDSK